MAPEAVALIDQSSTVPTTPASQIAARKSVEKAGTPPAFSMASTSRAIMRSRSGPAGAGTNRSHEATAVAGPVTAGLDSPPTEACHAHCTAGSTGLFRLAWQCQLSTSRCNSDADLLSL
jgi:hypothetical protein